MRVQKFQHLPREAAEIRREVFMQEQGFTEEFDELDDKAIHLILFDVNEAVGTCRIFYNDRKKSHVIGRLAVRKLWRGKKAGQKLLSAAEKAIKNAGGHRVMLDAQMRAAGFYEKCGYRREGEEFLEEYCPHIVMVKEL